MKNSKLLSSQYFSNLMRVFSLAFAVALLGALFIYLPQLREAYQAKQQSFRIDGENPTQPTGETDGNPMDVGISKSEADKLLEEWKTDQNTIRIKEPESATEKFNNLPIIRKIPVSESEVQRIHESNQGLDCEIIPARDLVLMKDFRRFLTPWDSAKARVKSQALYTRREVMTVGFDMRDSDQSQLPTLSAREILKFLQGNYVSLQLRIEKDPVDGKEFLHPRPMATIVEFSNPSMTQPPRKALAESLKNYRGVGMFLAPGETPTADLMRTLVMIHRSERKIESTVSKPHFEYIFIRAIPDFDGKLKLHTFVTKDDRQRLLYLQPNSRPTSSRRCTIQTMLSFTKFELAGLNPVKSVTTGSVIDGRSEYSLERLNKFTESQNLEGTALENLPVILDAIINREIATL